MKQHPALPNHIWSMQFPASAVPCLCGLNDGLHTDVDLRCILYRHVDLYTKQCTSCHSGCTHRHVGIQHAQKQLVHVLADYCMFHHPQILTKLYQAKCIIYRMGTWYWINFKYKTSTSKYMRYNIQWDLKIHRVNDQLQILLDHLPLLIEASLFRGHLTQSSFMPIRPMISQRRLMGSSFQLKLDHNNVSEPECLWY